MNSNNTWNQFVPVFLSKGRSGEQNFVRVVVNGRPYQIPRGKQQLVPRPVYEVLSRSECAKLITEAYDADRSDVKR